MNNYLFGEMAKLIAMLVNAGIEFELNPFCRHAIKDGKVTNETNCWVEICHPNRKVNKVSVSMTDFTYGGKDGLLEALGSNNDRHPAEDPVGWLTAEQAFDFFVK